MEQHDEEGEKEMRNEEEKENIVISWVLVLSIEEAGNNRGLGTIVNGCFEAIQKRRPALAQVLGIIHWLNNS